MKNRWKLDLQAGWYQALGKDFTFQLAGAGRLVWRQQGRQAADRQLSRRTTPHYFPGMAFLQFRPRAGQQAWATRNIGAEQEYLSGVGRPETRPISSSIRAELSKFGDPTFQGVLGDVSRDVETAGAFMRTSAARCAY